MALRKWKNRKVLNSHLTGQWCKNPGDGLRRQFEADLGGHGD
jgi:hypothetical protein